MTISDEKLSKLIYYLSKGECRHCPLSCEDEERSQCPEEELKELCQKILHSLAKEENK